MAKHQSRTLAAKSPNTSENNTQENREISEQAREFSDMVSDTSETVVNEAGAIESEAEKVARLAEEAKDAKGDDAPASLEQHQQAHDAKASEGTKGEDKEPPFGDNQQAAITYDPSVETYAALNKEIAEVTALADQFTKDKDTLEGKAAIVGCDFLYLRNQGEGKTTIRGKEYTWTKMLLVRSQASVKEARVQLTAFLKLVFNYAEGKSTLYEQVKDENKVERTALDDENPRDSLSAAQLSLAVNTSLLVFFSHKGFCLADFVKEGRGWIPAKDGAKEVYRRAGYLWDKFSPKIMVGTEPMDTPPNRVRFASQTAITTAYNDFRATVLGEKSGKKMDDFGNPPPTNRGTPAVPSKEADEQKSQLRKAEDQAAYDRLLQAAGMAPAPGTVDPNAQADGNANGEQGEATPQPTAIPEEMRPTLYKASIAILPEMAKSVFSMADKAHNDLGLAAKFIEAANETIRRVDFAAKAVRENVEFMDRMANLYRDLAEVMDWDNNQKETTRKR